MAFDIEGARKAGYADNEIADYLGSQNNFDVSGARKSGYKDEEIISHLSNIPDKSPSILEEIPKGLKAGVQQIRGMGYGLGAIAGKVTESPEITSWAKEGLQDVEAKTPKPAVASVKDVKDISSAAKYLAYGVSSNLPNMALSLAAGVPGVALGSKALALAGAGLASYGMEAGSIASDQLTETGEVSPTRALTGAIPAAALDVVPEWYLAKRLGFFGGVTKGSRLSRTAKGFGEQFALEAPTEAMQSVIERASVPGKSITNAEAWDEYINSFILGGATGGVVGGVGGVFSKSAPVNPIEEKLKADETANQVELQIADLPEESKVVNEIKVVGAPAATTTTPAPTTPVEQLPVTESAVPVSEDVHLQQATDVATSFPAGTRIQDAEGNVGKVIGVALGRRKPITPMLRVAWENVENGKKPEQVNPAEVKKIETAPATPTEATATPPSPAVAETKTETPISTPEVEQAIESPTNPLANYTVKMFSKDGMVIIDGGNVQKVEEEIAKGSTPVAVEPKSETETAPTLTPEQQEADYKQQALDAGVTFNGMQETGLPNRPPIPLFTHPEMGTTFTLQPGEKVVDAIKRKQEQEKTVGKMQRPQYTLSPASARQPAFYSKLAQTIESSNFTKMPVPQLRAFLKGKQVTDAEIENIVGGMQGTVSKQDVMDEIKANSTEFKDVVLGEPNENVHQKEYREIANAAAEKYGRDNSKWPDDIWNKLDELSAKHSDEGSLPETPTHFSQYTEPGAVPGSYREMFVTAPYPSLSDTEMAEEKDMLSRSGVEGIRPEDRERWGKIQRKAEKQFENWKDGHDQYKDIANPIVRIRYNERNVDGKRILFVEEIQGPSDANQQKMPEWLRKRIYDIGVKRVLALAKEQGFDGVAWTTGEMQADRYDLSKEIKELEVSQDDNDRYTLDVTLPDGDVKTLAEGIMEDQLADYVGKDITAKILSNPNQGTFRGLDLKVGGEGLKSLYDRTLPAMFKKYGKEAVGEIALQKPVTGLSKRVYEGPSFTADDLRAKARTEDATIAGQLKEAATMMDLGTDYREAATLSFSFASAKLMGGEMVVDQESSKMIVPFLPITEKTPASYPQYSQGQQPSTSISLPIITSLIDSFKSKGINADFQLITPGNPIPPDILAHMQQTGIMNADGTHDVQGAYYNGKVYLFPENISSDKEAMLVASHELFHDGWNRLFNTMPGELGVKYKGKSNAILDAIWKEHNQEVRDAVKESNSQLDLSTRTDQRQAANEWLASQAYETQPKWYDKVVAMIRGFIRDVMGIDIKFEDAEIRQLIMDVGKTMREGATSPNVPQYVRNDFDNTVFTYQDTNQEKVIHSGWDTGNNYRYILEGTGDIFRSLSSKFPDPGYIGEKIDRIKDHIRREREGMHRDDTYQTSRRENREKFDTMIDQWENQPTESNLQEIAKQLNLEMLNGEFDKARYSISRIDDEIKNMGVQYARRSQNPNTWSSPESSKLSDFIYTMLDRQIDTRDVVKSIETFSRTSIPDYLNPDIKERAFTSKVAENVREYLDREFSPLLKSMVSQKVKLADFQTYLYNRHAEEANNHIASINPAMPDAGSGISTADAQRYLASLPPRKRAIYANLAARVDRMLAENRSLMVSYNLESQSTVDTWAQKFPHYVPLFREMGDDKREWPGIGAGFSVTGPTSKSRKGSVDLPVIDILANIAAQRERIIVRGEKNKIDTAMVNLSKAFPNEDWWKPAKPRIREVLSAEPETRGQMIREVDMSYKRQDNVIMARMLEGDKIVERGIEFNQLNPRAERMAKALKNLDMDTLGQILGTSAKITRYIAMMNTQLNPMFGPINFIRDVGTAMLNLSSTPIAGKQKEIMDYILPALKAIYTETRARNKGVASSTDPMTQAWLDFRKHGGPTGYRDLFRTSADRDIAIRRELEKIHNETSWAKTANKIASITNWLSDYNGAMENATRLSAYRVALDSGMSKEKAIVLAKSLTVDFNRKGQIATQAGALYAFFNASAQGSARMVETLIGPAGRKIMMGGIILGTVQALALAAAGFEENDPPEFVRERNIIIPTGGKSYTTLPMPLGFHIIPNIGRITSEWAMGGFKQPMSRFADLFGTIAESFNPMGSSGFSLQTITPTVIDPFAALSENKDWTGKQISRPNFSSLAPTPGFTRTRDTATWFSKQLSWALNRLTGGTEYKPGFFSPTADQIDFLQGQFTGGIGREANKLLKTGQNLYSGEDIPPYQIPGVGRFYGNTESQASQSTAFYNNLKVLNQHEMEIKGRQKNREPISDYLKDNPEARFWMMGNRVESSVSRLMKQKKEMEKRGVSRESIKSIDNAIAAQMRRFNETIKRATS